MPKVDIQAQVETDGALQVTEQRTFDFDGDFSAVWWAFDGLPQNASLKINGVRMANVDADGTVVGDWTTLPSEAFVLGWRESGGPGKDSYSFDAPEEQRVRVLQRLRRPSHHRARLYGGQRGARRIPT